MSDNALKKVRIATGGRNRGLVKNGTVSWQRLCKRLGKVTTTPEKFAEYMRGKVTWKNDLKNISGYWIGANCEGGRRTKKSISSRDVMCFDIDNGDLYEGDLLDELRNGLTPISKYEFFVHSSRSHTLLKPRLRVVFLLDSPVQADDYAPFSRFMAKLLDPTMLTVDPVSFRVAQMMYNPSCSKNVEDQFIAFHNEGEAVDPYEFLDNTGEDWQDFGTWPRCPGEDEMRQQVDKAEWPLDKKGVIGAFCRTYDIHQAIDEFLPEVYTDLDESGMYPRYKLADGSGGHGAVVYDDGVFLYSHHGTDEASDKNVNAFDLVRMHKFGGLDNSLRDIDSTPMRKRPSYKAMEELCREDVDVRGEMVTDFIADEALLTDLGDDSAVVDVRSELDAEIDDLMGAGLSVDDDLTDLGNDPNVDVLGVREDHANWLKDLDVDAKGIKPTIYNASVIIGNDARFRNCLAYNELTSNVTLVKPIAKPMKHLSGIKLNNTDDGDMVQDDHMNLIRAVIDSPAKPFPGYGLKLAMADAGAAMAIVARENSYHPIRRYIKRIKWDGVARAESLFIDYLGSPDNIYIRESAWLMLVGAVTRVFEPGHKFDTAIILEAMQGVRKSTFIKILARDRWFSELGDDFGNQQKMVEHMQGRWIIELPELKSFNKSDANSIKAFISGQTENVRMAYARTTKEFKRQCIFVGSTNDTQYLPDQTGNRRFNPIKVFKTKENPIDTDKLESEMDQIWAEAYQLYLAMRKKQPKGTLPLMLSQEAEVLAAVEQGHRVREGVEHTWAGAIETQANKPVLLSQLGNAHLELQDLDASEDVMVIRNIVSAQSIWTELLGWPAERLDNRAVATIGRAMSLIDGWSRGARIRSNYLPEGRATVWYRTAAFSEYPDHIEFQDGFFTEQVEGY